jgi:drug/metabolite transporter (DMT)-like permease
MAIFMLQRTAGKSAHDHVTLAILARIVTGLFMAMMSAFAKAAGEAGAGSGEIIFFRQALALPVVLLWVGMGPGWSALKTKRPKAHLSRAVIGLVSMSIMFSSLQFLPLAEAITIFFISPLVATSLSGLLLGEKVGPHRWLAVLVGFAGVLIVMRPGSSGAEVSTLGLTLAISAAVLMAGVTITLRQLGTTEHEAATVFWFTFVATVVMTCLYPFFYKPHPPATWLLMVCVGVCGAVIQIATVTSLRLAPISLTAPFDYMQLFWAALIGWLFWADLPAWTTVVGGLLIASAGLYTFYRERLRRQTIAEEATPIN